VAWLALPSIVGEIGLRKASSADAATSIDGIRWLRALGSEEVLLRACYGRPNRVENIYSFGQPVSPAAARTIYYLVSDRGKDNGFALRGRVADLELAGPEAVVRVSRTGDIRQAWVNDSRNPEP
jgi:hypothetical protein